VNPPSGRWENLESSGAISVTLPTTVEEHYWGVNGYRTYRDEYFYETQDTAVKNGNYLGVSWWSRDLDVPKSFKGKKAILFVRGARLRAEVYFNRQLVGYNIITETSFSCDVTAAIKPGQRNKLAIRITNPGGRLDWLDTQLMNWGEASFHRSHGFGGLDRGLLLSAHDPVYLGDLWVMNKPDLDKITGMCDVVNSTAKLKDVRVIFEVFDPAQPSKVCASSRESVRLSPSSQSRAFAELVYPSAKPWTVESPHLYKLRAKVMVGSGGKSLWSDSREVTFGFRWFESTGIGQNAMLRLNGQRIRLLSAISWGFWGHNGLWPTRELAEREVRAAKAFGMNCIQFHRNVGKTEVLDAQDRLGLLRYMEPGGGQTAFGEKFSLYSPSPAGTIDVSGEAGDAQTFAEKYMEEKIVRMVRDHRSHPSLIMYSLQNEIHPDLKNPRIFRILRRVHGEDPSRIVVLKSGFPENNPVNEAWMQPYDDEMYFDHGDGYSGWWDAHTVGGPGVWKDEMYKSFNEFTHRSTNDKEIVVWGEMLGAAAPDNHAAMVRELRGKGGKSYDLKDHEEILAAYERFLDRWKFRTAFPTADALFASIGNRSYDFWGRVIETSRLSESNDCFVMSGWESTAIENHSGLVDNLRGFKGNPSILGKRTANLRPVIKAPSLVFTKGERARLNVFLLNESHVPHGRQVQLSIRDQSGTTTDLGTYPVPPYREDTFVYVVAPEVVTPPLNTEGIVTVEARLIDKGSVTTAEEFLVVDPKGTGNLPSKIGILTSHPLLMKPFELLPGLSVGPYRPGTKYDVLIAANRFVTPPESSVEPDREIKGTDEPELYRSIHYGAPENFDYIFPGLRKGNVKVTLKFAEIFRDAPGIRVFDVALNGVTALRDFDVFKLAGGKNIALDSSFVVPAREGVLRITVPRVASGSARFCAIEIDDGDTVIAVKCGGAPYRDKKGLLWGRYEPPVQLDSAVLELVRQGTPLLILSEGEAATTAYATRLDNAGALRYLEYVGEARASWMGSWYFVRKHPVFDGLPVDCAMGSYYQVGVDNSGGVMVDGPDVDVFVGYSRDHDRNIGAGSFTTLLGKGKILFHCIPGVVSGLNSVSTGMHPVMLKRLISNSLRYLSK
jgi:beta-galactosidase